MANAEFQAFAKSASPHSWLHVAANLHDMAVLLRNTDASTRHWHGPDGTVERWTGSGRGVFLLAGFALENALKGMIVYERPELVSNGKMAGTLTKHDLPALQELATHAPYRRRRRARQVLATFSSGLTTWARYPCGKDHASTTNEAHLPDALWADYLWLAASYGRRLGALVQRGWKGPSGAHERWILEGDRLGAFFPMRGELQR